MKKRIDIFFSTYFYFNKQERKGVLSLLFLLVFFQLAIFSFPLIFKNTILSEPSAQMKIWALEIDSNEQFFESKYVPKKDFKNKFKPHEKGGAFFVMDTLTYPKKFAKKYPIEINSADSETLVTLPKIGPVLAGRIVQYRNKLRGFHNLSQLMEIWGFKEDFLFDLEGKISLDSRLVNVYKLNHVGVDELKSHPYFKFTLSKAIVNFRNQHGNYARVEDIKQIKLVNDSIYSLVSPYLMVN
ncbi:MAG: helix-hairpin-helix domain-containing protein [bacterium]|nr:helix-hairpin-helix domain-containing protein [bacterium]